MNSSEREKERKLAFLLAVMKGHNGRVRHLLEARTMNAISDRRRDLGSAIVLAVGKQHDDCLQYFMCPGNSGDDQEKVADLIKFREDENGWYYYKDVYVNALSMLHKSFGGNQAEIDKMCVDTMRQVYDSYWELKRNLPPRMMYVLTWCLATVLHFPTDCISCLFKTGESNVSELRSCIDVVIALAVVNSHFDCVKDLLENYQTPSLGMLAVALAVAACKSNIECFNYLLEILETNSTTCAEVKCFVKLGLKLAAANGDLECVKYCLVKVDDCGSSVDTAFVLSAKNGHFECVKFLFDTGNIWDINREYDSYGESHTAFMFATMRGDVECVKFLLGTGQIDVNHRNRFKKSAFMLSAMHGQVECLKLLLGTGQVEINEFNEFGETAFMLSAKEGHVECLKYLRDTGLVNIFEIDKGRNTPLMVSAMMGHGECVKYLLDSEQVHINHQNYRGDTALTLSASHGHVECVRCLLDNKMLNVNRDNFEGDTALMLSAKNGHVKCVKFLLDSGKVDINHENEKGNIALMLSAEKGHVECLRSLLDTEKVDISHKNGEGSTALMLSAEKGHLECLRLLLDTEKVDMDYNDYHEYILTAYLWAALYGQLECVKCFLNSGLVDIHSSNCDGETALTQSAVSNEIECVKFFLSTGKVHLDLCNEGTFNAIDEVVCYELFDCLALLLEHIPPNERVGDRMKAIFLKHPQEFAKLLFKPFFHSAGVFHWSWYPEFPSSEHGSLTRALVINSYAPSQFEWGGKISSPLQHAFMINDDGLVRYLIANLYLTPFDAENFQSDKNLQRHVISNGSESLKELHGQIFSSPWRLEALSLLKVSGLLGNVRREKDIEKLGGVLPAYCLRHLGFTNSIRRLCKYQWQCIDVNQSFLLNGRLSTRVDENNVRVKCCTDFCLGF